MLASWDTPASDNLDGRVSGMMRRENERFSFKRKYSYKDKVRRITKQRVTNVCLYRPIPTNYPIFFSIKSL